MLVLGIDSSTPVASAAIVGIDGLIGETTLNVGLTHSEQLLPLIDNLFQQTGLALNKMEGIAIAGGPGSFTGLRIGMSTAKGLAQGRGIPLVSIPTLLALAWKHTGSDVLVSPVMNARRQEVYAALFCFSGGTVKQLIPDCAVDPFKWAGILKEYQENVLFLGDGLEEYADIWTAVLQKYLIMPPKVSSLPSAATVAWLGREKMLAGQKDDLYELKPLYIRPVEAQEKLDRKNKQEKK